MIGCFRKHPSRGRNMEPATQACALTGTQTGDFSLCGKRPNQQSFAGQGSLPIFNWVISFYYSFKSCLYIPGWCGSWIECQPANQRAAGSIPSQGTCLGCGPGPQLGVHERQPHIDVSLSLSPSLPLSLKINK